MRPAGFPLVCLLLVATLAPPAGAHGEHGFESGTLVDHLYVSVGLEMALPLAGVPTQLSIAVTNVSSGREGGVDETTIRLLDPSNRTVPMDTYRAQAFRVGNVTFATHGEWRLNVTLPDGVGSAEIAFPVYREGPYVWDSPNAATGLFAAGAESEIAFRITEWETGGRAPAPDDVTIRIEHWEKGHARKLGETVAPTEPDAPGLVVMTHVFDAPGEYHLFLASPTLDLGYEDRPFTELRVLTCEEVRAYAPDHACAKAQATPGAGVAGVAAAALAALALTRRRSPRSPP